MKTIKLENWKRQKHYEYFKELSYPHFSLCANIDITKTHQYIKEHKLPMHLTMVYLITSACNAIEAMRYRPRTGEILVHDYLHPAFTIMADDETFSFCKANYYPNYHEFVEKTSELIEWMKHHPVIEDDDDDQRIFMTTIPWVSFTNIMHPMDLEPADYIPRVAWGKFFDDHDKKMMPLSIQAHHGTVDGIDVGKWFLKAEEIFMHPEKYLG